MKYYKDALYIAAERDYEDEVLDSGMEPLIVGEDKGWASRKEWIQARVKEYIEEAALERAGA
jgi:hypothetical protein